jgi:sugar transferase EpsL
MTLKRTIDIIVAFTLLVILAPVLALVALAVRIHLGSPVLFRQQRPGRGGRPFMLIKFRTMRNSTNTDGHLLDDAQRLTPFGQLLRTTSLDELPELWNVLIGEMSLVGPRPLLMEYLPRYSATQQRRHELRPGITGWAQINGRNSTSWEARLEHDVWYVEHQSLLLDLRILVRTVRQVLVAEGVAQPGHATMPRFMGSGGTP